MSPYSQERADWIESRLFCLANMAREHARNGRARATRFCSEDQEQAYMVFHETMKQIQAERLMLLSERQVIEDYDRET